MEDIVSKYTRKRSQFYLQVREGATAITISANEMTKNVINIRYPSLVQANAERGWQPSPKGSFDSLWIPRNFMDWYAYQDMKKMKAWAEIAGNQCIWLSTNANTQPFFATMVHPAMHILWKRPGDWHRDNRCRRLLTNCVVLLCFQTVPFDQGWTSDNKLQFPSSPSL